jgi:hypothetical protein
MRGSIDVCRKWVCIRLGRSSTASRHRIDYVSSFFLWIDNKGLGRMPNCDVNDTGSYTSSLMCTRVLLSS